MHTRRSVLGAGASVVLAGVLGGCGRPVGGQRRAPVEDGAHLAARPAEDPAAALLDTAPEPGTRALDPAAVGDALLHVPADLEAGRLLPLVLPLHGAGGDAAAGVALLRPLADQYGLVLLAPASRGRTWDAVRGDPGPDAELIDRALARTFAELPIDPARVSVAGFSDGASYALGLGLANGELFSAVVAFSPGFVPSDARSGMPRIFVSHGTDDTVLPIDRTSRRIVPALEAEGYDVTYREFAGPHTVPPDVARAAVEWLGRS